MTPTQQPHRTDATPARTVDSCAGGPAARCRYTTEAAWPGAEPGEYLTCTATEGHPGRHQLATANRYDD